MSGRGAVYRRAQAVVRQRSGGWCESPQAWKDEHGCDLRAVHTHHVRTRRSEKDDSPDNLLALCARCHQNAHHFVAEAYAAGLLVRHS